jgi:hypothetical protein
MRMGFRLEIRSLHGSIVNTLHDAANLRIGAQSFGRSCD